MSCQPELVEGGPNKRPGFDKLTLTVSTTGIPLRQFMQTQQRYFLKAADRLKSRKAIEELFAKGNAFSEFPLRVFWILGDEATGLKAGFTASSRNFKKAVDRNRIKRLMRESYRLQKDLLENESIPGKSLHIFFIYTGKDLPEYRVVFEKTGLILKRLVKLIHENPE